MCVSCGGGAGRGPWGGAFSAQSLRRASLRASTQAPAARASADPPKRLSERPSSVGPAKEFRPALSQPATAASAGGPPPWPRRPRGGARPTRGVSPAAARRRRGCESPPAEQARANPSMRKPARAVHTDERNVFKYDYRTGFLLRMHRLRYNSRVAAGRARWGPVLGAGLPRGGVDAKWSCPPSSPIHGDAAERGTAGLE